MRIEVKGRNLQVTEELREITARRFEKVSKQVSDLAVLEVEVADERTPGSGKVAEATLHLKGTTLRAKDSSPDVKHAINLVAEDMARQVKRHRDKRRARRESRAAAGELRESPAAEPEEGPLPAV
jgi:putative sigma-54 modulation protein